MDPFKARKTRTHGPEAKIQLAIMAKLKAWDWLCIATHGNEYQMGFPDLYCAHRKYGQRWIECKNPSSYAFTDAQREVFPLLDSKGVGIWVLTSAEDNELMKIFSQPNWFLFLPIMK